MVLSQLWPQVSQVVRDTVLGPKPEGNEARKGRFFADNGMLVSEVEILQAEIQDSVIADLMKSVQRESVMLTIGDRQAQEKLSSQKLRTEIDRQNSDLLAAAKQREASIAEALRKLKHEADLGTLRERETLQAEQGRMAGDRELSETKKRIEREALAQQASLDAVSRDAATKAGAAMLVHQEEIDHLAKLRTLDVQLLQAQAQAAVAERSAVQPQLVEALTALGDKALLGEIAHNMNLVSLFRGKEAGEILKDIVGGSRFVPALTEALSVKPSAKTAEPGAAKK